MSKLKPLGDRVLLEQVPLSEKSAGGIIMNTSLEQERQQHGAMVGEVVEVGPDVELVKVGDVVKIARYAGDSFFMSELLGLNKKADEVRHHLIDESLIQGIFDEETANEYKAMRGE